MSELGKLTVQTAPTVLPVSVAEAKTVLRITHTTHDVYIESLIKGMRAFIESTCRLTLTNTTYDMRLNRFPAGVIELRRPPVSSVTSVKYVDVGGDTQTLTVTTDYHVDIYAETPYIEPQDTWPATEKNAPNEVTVQYVAGYGAIAASIDEHVRQSLLALITHVYENPAAMAEYVNGLHPNPVIDRIIASFRRFTIP